MYTDIFERLPVLNSNVDHFSTALERRKHKRVNLVCRVQLYRHLSPDHIETYTENICSTGFYCRVDEAFFEGECLKCDIYLPTHGPEPARHLCLKCDASVLRVEPSNASYGLACRVGKFHLHVI